MCQVFVPHIVKEALDVAGKNGYHVPFSPLFLDKFDKGGPSIGYSGSLSSAKLVIGEEAFCISKVL